MLHFKEVNFGDQKTHDYTIALHRLDDSKCDGTPPCYGGTWYSVESKEYQGNNLVAKSALASDGSLVFSATDFDPNRKQTYSGTAPNDTTREIDYTGDWTDTTGDIATFSFVQQP